MGSQGGSKTPCLDSGGSAWTHFPPRAEAGRGRGNRRASVLEKEGLGITVTMRQAWRADADYRTTNSEDTRGGPVIPLSEVGPLEFACRLT